MKRLTVLLVLLAAPPASAASFGERPFETVPGRGVATCLRATGAPGGLVRYGSVDLGRLGDCAAVRDAGGTRLAAAVTRRGAVRAVLGDGVPVTLGRAGAADASVAAAMSPSGHAIVAWLEHRGGLGTPFRIVVARRAPGLGFGAREPLTPWRHGAEFGSTDLQVGIDDAGVATVAWLRSRVRGGFPLGDEYVVTTATAAAGAPFARQRIAGRARDATRLALAVAPDGWAVLAHSGSARAFARPPGGRFAGVFASGVEAIAPAVAVRDGGGAVLAWRVGAEERRAGVLATTRTGPGAFGPLRTLVAARPRRPGTEFSAIALATTGAPLDLANGLLRAALAADGRALLAWTTHRKSGGGVLTPRVAPGTLAGGFDDPQRLGSPVRDANGVAPLFLADGRAALAWTDNDSSAGFAERAGRVHLAVEGAPVPAEPAPPVLRLHARRTQRRFASQGLLVRASCDRACDVRAVLHSPRGRGFFTVTRSLRAAGTARLWLRRYALRSGRVRVVVHATAPGGHRTAAATTRVHVLVRRPLPVPPPLGVRARRRGDAIVVTWRTASPARRAVYLAFGRHRRNGLPDFASVNSVFGGGRTRFRLRLHPARPQRIRWVEVFGASLDNGRPTRSVKVSVPTGSAL